MQLTPYQAISVSEQLRLEQLLIKKYRLYSTIISDQQLKIKCEQASAEHQAHYDRLLSHLN